MHLRLGDGGGGEHERRVGAVRRAHPPQPAQHLGDVGAEHAAVVVALVDDDVLQRAEELRPPVVRGEQRAVQHVGVGQDVLGVVARPLPLLARAVAVVGGEPDVEPERLQPGQLVLGERLGRGEVEDGGASLAAGAAGRRGSRRGRAAGRPATCPTRCRSRRTTCRPAWAASAASAWWRHGVSRPRSTYAARTSSGTQAGQGASSAARAGSTSTWVSRSSRPGTAERRSRTSPTDRGTAPSSTGTPTPSSPKRRRHHPDDPARRRPLFRGDAPAHYFRERRTSVV